MFKRTKGGSIYHVQGLDCNVPKPPPKDQIQGYDLPKKQQKWARTELPDNWEKDREEEEFRQKGEPSYFNLKMEEFRVQEWNRRWNGHWFYNNGKKTYITGEHYFYVNWWKCDFGYPDFRIPDLELYYFLQYAIEDPCSMGINEITLRRDGKTARAGAFLYNGVSMTPNVYGGIQSKTGQDAQKVFLKSVVLPWENLPDFFRPIYDYNSTQKKEIRFFPPGAKGKAALVKHKSKEKGLESIIDFKTSGEFAYDGEKLFRMLLDEAGKLEEADVWERHQVLQPCFEQWGKVNAPYFGKMYCTTTVEDMAKVGDGFKRLTDRSELSTKDENGRTLSGLYNYFKPAYMGYAYDDYGFAMAKEGKAHFTNRRKALEGDPGSLSSYIRKHPFTVKEAFMIDGDMCVFNAMILNERHSTLNFNEYTTSRGDFIRKEGGQEGKVVFRPSENGPFEVAWLPEVDEDTNKTTEITPAMINNIHTKRYKPDNSERFVIGTDPVDHNQTVDKRRSNAAAYVFRKYDHLVDNGKEERDWETHNFVVEYLYRPNESVEYYEKMINLCIFFGCEILVENQKVGIINHFRLRGYERFIMNRPDNVKTTQGSSQDTPGAPSSKFMIHQYTNLLQTFIEYHGHRLKFCNLVDDLLVFNPVSPTKNDASVAAGFTLIGSQKTVKKSIASVGANKYFRKYDNRGDLSRNVG